MYLWFQDKWPCKRSPDKHTHREPGYKWHCDLNASFNLTSGVCLAKVKGTLTLSTRIPSFTHLVYYINQLSGHMLQQFPKNPSLLLFSHMKAKVAKCDIAIKQLSVNLGLSFEQTIVGLCPRCYTPSFIEIGPLVPGRF